MYHHYDVVVVICVRRIECLIMLIQLQADDVHLYTPVAVVVQVGVGGDH